MIYAIIKENGEVVGSGCGEAVSAKAGQTVEIVSKSVYDQSLNTLVLLNPDAVFNSKIDDTLKLMAVERLQIDGKISATETSLVTAIINKSAEISAVTLEK